MKTVFVFGMAVVDFIHFVSEIPRGGLKHRSNDAEICGGGTGANAAVSISRLGGRSLLCTRVGDDLIANIILRDLKQEGVGIDYVRRSKSGNSPFSSICVDKSGERQIVSYRGSGLSEDVDWLENLQDLDACLVDLRWPEGLEVVLRQTRSRGIPTVVDGERADVLDTIWQASHLAFSRQGIQHLTGETIVIDALRSVASTRTNWICVTDGENGVHRVKNGKIEHIPAFDIEAMNTLGAGDVWHGAFTLRLAEGVDEDEAAIFANAAAALKCQRINGRASFPRRDEVDAFLDSHGT